MQEAVAKCLTPLVPAIKADASEIVKKLLLVLLGSENYGERKGQSVIFDVDQKIRLSRWRTVDIIL